MAKVMQRMSNYSYENVNDVSKTITCPRYSNDVYALGVNLQYYIGDMYLQLAEISQGEVKSQFKRMAVNELEIKQQIQQKNNAYLNELLSYFYNNGGKIIEAPLASEQAKEIHPFFNRIINTFIKRLESWVVLAAEGTVTPDQLDSMISYDIIEMYGNMCKLFKVDEIDKAFEALIRVREKVRK